MEKNCVYLQRKKLFILSENRILITIIQQQLKTNQIMEIPFAESWKIKMIESIKKSTREEREQWLKEAHYNDVSAKSRTSLH